MNRTRRSWREGDPVVRCDKCQKPARRRSGHPCPDHWFYLESTNVSDGCVYVVWACSEACRDELWRHGPGPQGHVIESQIASPQLSRRASRVEVTFEDLAFLRQVAIDMTIRLAEEVDHDQHRPKRERLLKCILGLIESSGSS